MFLDLDKHFRRDRWPQWPTLKIDKMDGILWHSGMERVS